MGKYSSSPEWDDVVPIPQDDGGPHPLAAIAYTDEYAEAMSYLRAVMAQEEKSERVLGLTQDVIRMNPAHYTVWLYRADTVSTLKKDLHKELEWLNKIALKSLKNYQIWHHRQTIMSQLTSLPPNELSFLATMFGQDAKNYHVWSYRQWLVQHFALWEDNPASTEIAYIEHLLDIDVRNNSAWNHRWFIVFGRAEKRRHEHAAAARKAAALSNTAAAASPGTATQLPESAKATSPPNPTPIPAETDPDAANTIDPSIIDREITFSRTAIDLAPQNPSPWNYLRGILRFTGRPLATQRAFAERFADIDREDEVRSSHALDFLADVYGSMPSAAAASSVGGGVEEPPRAPAAGTGMGTNTRDDGRAADDDDGREKAGKALELLARRYDPIRRGYWNWRRSLIGLGDVVEA